VDHHDICRFPEKLVARKFCGAYQMGKKETEKDFLAIHQDATTTQQ